MPEERDILEGLQKGDLSFLELLYREYGKSLYAYALSLTRNKELAEEATADAFVQLYEYIQKKREVRHLKAMLYTICRNNAFDAMKRAMKTDPFSDENEIADSAFPMDKKLEVRLAVEQLPSPEREIVILYCVHEMKHRETAQILNLPEGTVRWKYRNAIKLLRESLNTVD